MRRETLHKARSTTTSIRLKPGTVVTATCTSSSILYIYHACTCISTRTRTRIRSSVDVATGARGVPCMHASCACASVYCTQYSHI